MIIVNLDFKTIDVKKIFNHIRVVLYDEETAIVIASENEYGSLELIKYKLFDYLKMPIDKKSIYNCIDLYERGNEIKWFTYSCCRTEFKIAVSKIIYLENVDRKVVIHTINEQISFYGKLSECRCKDCFSSFIDIHQSFLVNPIHVEKNKLFVRGGDVLPISRNKFNDIRKLI